MLGTPLENTVLFYKTIKKKDVQKMPPEDKDATIGAALRCERKDLQVSKELRDEYLKIWEESKKFIKQKI